MKLTIRLIKRKEPIEEFVEFGKAVEEIKEEIAKMLRIYELLDWMEKKLKRIKWLK